jgi:hypothetical protein
LRALFGNNNHCEYESKKYKNWFQVKITQGGRKEKYLFCKLYLVNLISLTPPCQSVSQWMESEVIKIQVFLFFLFM